MTNIKWLSYLFIYYPEYKQEIIKLKIMFDIFGIEIYKYSNHTLFLKIPAMITIKDELFITTTIVEKIKEIIHLLFNYRVKLKYVSVDKITINDYNT